MDELKALLELPQTVANMATEIAELKRIVLGVKPVAEVQEDNRPSHELVDIYEAQKITLRSKPTIYRLAQTGQIPGYKNGKKWYFYRDELESWINTGGNSYSKMTRESIQMYLNRETRGRKAQRN